MQKYLWGAFISTTLLSVLLLTGAFVTVNKKTELVKQQTNEISIGNRTQDSGWQKILLAGILTDQLDDDVVQVDLQGANIINGGSITSANAAITNLSATNIALPQTSSTTYGMITNGVYTWLHNYGAPGAQRWNTFLGVGAGNTTFTSNTMFTTGIGAFALNAITTGTQNTGIGHGVMQYTTTGSENTGVGSGALYAVITGNKNVALGNSAAVALLTGNSNISIGYTAYGNATSGNSNTAIGTAALYTNTADYNIAIGHQAMVQNTSGGLNQAFGFQSLYNNLGGSQNAAYGNSSLYNNTTGIGNTAMGGFSLYHNTGGIYNTVIGYQAGLGAGNTSLLYNTLIGTQATSILNGAQYSTALGYNAQVSKSNQMVLGGTNVTETLLRGNVGIGTSTPIANLAISSGATTTIFLDSTSTSKGGCFVIKDSDGSGYTFLTANNGTGTFSTNDCR